METSSWMNVLLMYCWQLTVEQCMKDEEEDGWSPGSCSEYIHFVSVCVWLIYPSITVIPMNLWMYYKHHGNNHHFFFYIWKYLCSLLSNVSFDFFMLSFWSCWSKLVLTATAGFDISHCPSKWKTFTTGHKCLLCPSRHKIIAQNKI